ncbi:hypothetical protein LCGC14_1692720 [marine sediment metagenome]|uniref:Uncharacterized protein n=1 Tax=marine sediment metagenome TaxID=412755 RepID=A0A0F9HKS4_9ZZZZ
MSGRNFPVDMVVPFGYNMSCTATPAPDRSPNMMRSTIIALAAAVLAACSRPVRG